jgi:hypothetical protein
VTVSDVTLTAQGQLFKASTAFTGIRPGGGTRGRITKFTMKSRKRFLERIAQLELKKRLGYTSMVTLTTQAILTPPAAKKYMDTFCKRLKRKFPLSVPIWMMEFQERGAPHFHLLILNMGYWPKEQLQTAWGEIVGEERPFTRIESARSWQGVISYVAKYMAKVDKAVQAGYHNVDEYAKGTGENGVSDGCGANGLDHMTYFTAAELADFSVDELNELAQGLEPGPGRFWGIRNRKHMPLGHLEIFRLPFGWWLKSVKQLGQLFYAGVRPENCYGFSLFIEDPTQFLYASLDIFHAGGA